MSHSFRKQQQESYSAYLSLGFLQRQLCKRQLFRQQSTVDCFRKNLETQKIK